jgi:rod shape-determining protein MreD
MYSWTAIFTSLVIAILLAMLPVPEWAIWLRPSWVLMVLIYWAITAPYRVSVGTAWITGIIVDLLTGTLLGEHALAYTVAISFASKMHIRLRLYPLLQQGISVFIFVLLYQFILYCIQGFIGELPGPSYWLSSVTSMLLWPWLYILMRDYRKWLKLGIS